MQGKGRKKPILFDQSIAREQKREENIKNGDYVYSLAW